MDLQPPHPRCKKRSSSESHDATRQYPRSLFLADEIETDLKQIEGEIADMLAEVTE